MRRIHRELARTPTLDFETLNRWVYRAIFLTPREDPWLGLVEPMIYVGLDDDGIEAAAAGVDP